MANIYVIDDDDQLLRMVGLMLERGGHTATLIDQPAAGLKKIREAMPDLLILDVMMPKISGHQLCREIRADEQIAHLPILVLTARAQEVDREMALKSGADAYLSKPVNGNELLEKINALLNSPRLEKSPKAAFVAGFMAMIGGIGRTTLAVNFAGALRQISQKEVCLVELTPAGGQIASHFRMQAKTSWADLPPAAELDWDLLKQHLMRHSTGLCLLASPPNFTSSIEPSGELMKKMLAILSEKMAAIVIDLPGVFNPAFQAAIEASDILFHVVNPTVISIQVALQTNRTLAAEHITTKPPIHILNQVSPQEHIPASAVERGLHAKLAFQIGFDSNQMRALTQGIPLTYTSAKSPIPVTIKHMADVLWHRTHPVQ